MRQHEAQRRLREVARAAADDRFRLVDVVDRLLQPPRRQEVLPHVVRRELRVGAELPGQQPRGQRNARDDAVALRLRGREELARRRLVEDVVEHLDRVRPAALDDLHPLLGRADGDAPRADLPGVLEHLHRFLDLLAPELVERRVVGLIEVDVVGAEALQRAVDGVKDVLLGEVLAHLPGGGADDADLRGDDDLVAPPRQDDAEQRLAAAEAVAVGGVEEGDAELARAPDRGERLVVAGAPPPQRRPRGPGRAADRPRAEADGTDPDPRAPEIAILHPERL